MMPPGPNDLLLIRHAPADHGGRLCGRTDVAALLPPEGVLSAARDLLAGCACHVTSPALRCRQTAGALFPGGSAGEDARLWEQDFGEEDGRPFAELSDLGPLSHETLATRRPPGGESFADMAARARPALLSLAQEARLGGPVAVVAHAGTVRAGLALALGVVAPALAFEVAPFSMTRLRCFAGGISIASVNEVLA